MTKDGESVIDKLKKVCEPFESVHKRLHQRMGILCPLSEFLSSNEKSVWIYIENKIQFYEVRTSMLVCGMSMSWSLAVCAVTVLHFLVDTAVLASVPWFHKDSSVPALLAVSTLYGTLPP